MVDTTVIIVFGSFALLFLVGFIAMQICQNRELDRIFKRKYPEDY